MADKEIQEFVTKSLTEIRESIPEGFAPEGKFDFEISVIVSKEKEGKIDLKLAQGILSNTTQQTHKIRFSIVDINAQKRNLQFITEFLRRMAVDLQKLEQTKALPPPKKSKKV